MAIASYLKPTEVAVNNSEGSMTVAANTTKIRLSGNVDFEFRIATGGAGSYCATEDHIDLPGRCLRGSTLYLWSAGNGTISVLEQLGVAD